MPQIVGPDGAESVTDRIARVSGQPGVECVVEGIAIAACQEMA
ncbi:hypothetical protein N566_24565 [Streptomycetaceae bacterium MP113-05]|nr:hypothetical protein N566_24565 [Streptomycetaceae bacterium MP113-05]